MNNTLAPIRVVTQREALENGLRQPPEPCATGALKALCSNCHLRDLCLPCGLDNPDVARLDGMRFGRRRLKVGEELYRGGDKFKFVYAVRSGTFKSSLVLADGREQVSGFHMAGELMGLDGVANGQHASAAIALEDAEVCAIHYAHFVERASGSADMQMVMARLMSREIVSRTFSAFQQQRMLEVDKRHIRIVNLEALKRTFETRVH